MLRCCNNAAKQDLLFWFGQFADIASVVLQAMPGLVELCTYLDSQGIPRGLITRNVLRSVHFFHDNRK